SVRSSRHFATAPSHAAPLGARGRPARYATVFSSGAIMPARAPASIDMLHTVMRSSIESARIASPVYSITCPVAPAVPIFPINARIRSFAVTPGARLPVIRASRLRGLESTRHCVASTCSTSLVPADLASLTAQPRERLRRCHLVDKVQIDVEQRHAVRELLDDVRAPDPIEQRLHHARAGSRSDGCTGFDLVRPASDCALPSS